jgi:RNA polymerase sigma-70 factor (ECF subfamily)
MHTTPASLLEQICQPDDKRLTAAAWERFVNLYTPLLYYWARRAGLQDSDAADLVQDVFAMLVRKLPDFSYDPGRKFRSWLRMIIMNKWRDRFKQPVLPSSDANDPSLSNIADSVSVDFLEESEYQQQLVKRALHLMQSEFSPSAWKACWEHVVIGRPAAEVAVELGISTGTVYVAKARVLTRLRQELAGLLD